MVSHSELISNKIAQAGALPAHLAYPKSVRGYAAHPKQPLVVDMPKDILGYDLRTNPISFGETLDRALPENKRLQSFRAPDSAYKTTTKIDVDYAPAKQETRPVDSSGSLVQASARLLRTNELDLLALATPKSGPFQVVDAVTPTIIPKNDIMPQVSFSTPASRLSAEPGMLVPRLPPQQTTGVQGRPHIKLDIIGDLTNRAIIPFNLVPGVNISHAPDPIPSLTHPTKLPEKTVAPSLPVSVAGRKAMPGKEVVMNEDAVCLSAQPIVPFQTALDISRTFSVKRESSRPAFQAPPVAPVDKLAVSYAAPADRPLSSTVSVASVTLDPQPKLSFSAQPLSGPAEPVRPLVSMPHRSDSFAFASLPVGHTASVKAPAPWMPPVRRSPVSFSVPATSIPTEPPEAPVPHFSLSTLAPDLFHIRG